MDQLDIAVHNTAHDAHGGLDSLAAKMGVNAQVLRNKCNPNNETHRLTLREAVAMMLNTGDLRILETMALLLGQTVEPRATVCNSSLLEILLRADAEHGDIARTLAHVRRDGYVTEREKACVREQISQARQALDELEGFVARGS